MPVTLPIDVYEVFEKSFGKENAHMVVKSLEATISDVTDYRWKVTKDELLDAIRKEFVTREIFEERMKVIEERFHSVDGRFNSLENQIDLRFKNMENQIDLRFHVVDERFKSLDNKMDERFHTVDERFKSLNFKLNIFLAIAFIALTFANPTFVKLLERLLKF